MRVGRNLRQILGLQFIIVGVVPLVLVAALLWLLVIPRIRGEVGIRHQILARSISGRVTTYLQGAERELLALADYIAARGAQSEAYWCSLLDSHVGRGEVFEAIYIGDPSGRVAAVGLPLNRRALRIDLIGLDLSRRPFYRAARNSDAITWSETFLSTVSARLAVALTIPIAEQVLVAEIAIDRLSDFIRFKTAEAHFLIMITDANSKVISDSARTFGGQSLNLEQIPMKAPSPAAALVTSEFRAGGRRYICTVVGVEKFGWKVLVAQPAEEAFHQVAATLRMVGAGIVVALALAVVFGWLAAKSFAAQFDPLIKQARAISDGDYAGPPDKPSSIQEFAQLGGHLQHMAAAIQSREKELSASEEKYRSVVSNAPVIIIQFNAEGVITLYEGQGLAVLDSAPGAVEGRSWFDLYRGDEALCGNARKAIGGAERQVTAQIRGRYFDMHFTPIREVRPPHSVLCVGVDITDRVKADQALQESIYLLKESQKAARLGHYTLDMATGRWESSEVLDDILGIDASFPKVMEEWLRIIHPEDRETVVAHLSDIMLPHQVFELEFRVIRLADQHERWVRGHGRLEAAAPRHKRRIIGIIQDITETKKLERQLLQSQKMEAIGQLAGGVAHDFNNMLGVIIGYAELIRTSLSPDSPILKNMLLIERAANKSRDITRQLLAFSRKQIIAPKLADLNQLIEGTVKTLIRLIGENIELHYTPQASLWGIKVDPTQVDQVLVNLAVNARDAMPNGGKLTIETGNVSLDESYSRLHADSSPGDYVQLTVSDNGVGIDKDQLPHIFEPFFTTKGVGEGTGLGLSTVYGIVKQNGGLIDVYSEPGKGSTFKIYFPKVEAAAEIEPTAPPPIPAVMSATILLVEDDEMVRTISASMLAKLGYDVVIAETPATALSICLGPDRPIDLLMTDVVMPEMSGRELADRIKAVRPDIKVLYMSGYTSNVIVNHGVLDKGVHFAQKPFNLTELAAKLREVMTSA